MIMTMHQRGTNLRFIITALALYSFAMTVGSLIPPSSSLFELSPFVKLLLMPFAQWFAIKGAKHRYSKGTVVIITWSLTAFYIGLAASTFVGYFR